MYCTVITLQINSLHSSIIHEQHMSVEEAIEYKKKNTDNHLLVLIVLLTDNGSLVCIK